MTDYDCIIVGGGISGLSVAYGLHRRGASVLLVEASARVGGAMHSLRTPDGYRLDCGPNTVTSKSAALWQHFAELGLMSERMVAERSSARRFILLGGRPELIPTAPGGLLRTPLLSTKAKLRILAEPLIPRTRQPDASVAAFFARRLGREPAERLVDPFVSGVYAGDPQATSVKAAFPSIWEAEQRAGSIVRGMLSRRARAPKKPKGARPRSVLFNFAGGLAAWPQAVAHALSDDHVWLNTRAQALRQLGQRWELVVEREGLSQIVSADVIVLAAPAYAAADLVAGLDAAAANALRGISYPPMAVVHLGYRRDTVAHRLDGFGVLCPSGERRGVLGILWSSTMFGSSAPAGHVLTTTFVGGARMPETTRQSDADLIAMVMREHEQILGARGAPAMTQITRWARAIPQYTAGHAQRMDALGQLEAEHPGLFLLGSYRDGLSVEKCWDKGIALADRLTHQGTLAQCTPMAALQ